MHCAVSRPLGLLASLALIGANAAPRDAIIDLGEQLYNGESTADVMQAKSGDGSFAYPTGSVSCAGCHGDTGEGGVEGGSRAPALTAAAAMSPPEASAWLAAALAGKRWRDGTALDARMPRYSMADASRDALATYVRTLPYPPTAGISADRIIIDIPLVAPDGDAVKLHRMRAILREHARLLDRQEPLFGRRIELSFVARAKPPLVSLDWRADAATPSEPRLTVLAADTGSGCGSLLPSSSAATDTLTRWLQQHGQDVDFPDDLEGDAPQPQQPRIAIVSAAKAAALQGRITSDPEHHYIVVEAGQPITRAIGLGAPVVVAGDLNLSAEAVSRLMKSHALTLPEATMLHFYRDGIGLIHTALYRQGRTITRRGLCRAMRGLSSSRQAITIIGARAEFEVVRVSQ